MTGIDEKQLGDDFSYIIRIADTDVDGSQEDFRWVVLYQRDWDEDSRDDLSSFWCRWQ